MFACVNRNHRHFVLHQMMALLNSSASNTCLQSKHRRIFLKLNYNVGPDDDTVGP